MIRSLEPSAGVRVLTIDRPERRNALDVATVTQLAVELEAAATGATRVVVLTGAAGNFCSGADLGGVEDAAFVDGLYRTLDALRAPSLVAIAAVDGFALGAGTQLACACDLRVATATASFGIPAAKLGLAVDHETVRRLAALAGDGTARAMLLAAETLSGDDAMRMGFVQRSGDLAAAVAWATEIAALAPLTQSVHKLALERSTARADDPEVAAARQQAWASEDLREGLAAFRERRPPGFRGV